MIEDLKLLLGLEDTDKKTEQQLQLILNATKQRLKFLLGGLEPPEEMEYIILDVCITIHKVNHVEWCKLT